MKTCQNRSYSQLIPKH